MNAKELDDYIISRAKQMVAKKMEMEGGSKFGRFLRRAGKSKVGRALRKFGKVALPLAVGAVASAAGQPELAPIGVMATKVALGGRKRGGQRKQSDKMKARGQLVSRLMKEEGMTLPQASRFIKENNLM